jgi:hypothetical protein
MSLMPARMVEAGKIGPCSKKLLNVGRSCDLNPEQE